jgi:hypothetical protein
MLFFCPECKISLGWMDKRTALSLTRSNPEKSRILQKIFKDENPRIHRRSDLMLHHGEKGLFFICSGCKGSFELTDLLPTSLDLLDPALNKISLKQILHVLHVTLVKYGKWADFSEDQKEHQNNIQAAISREVITMDSRKVRCIPAGESWCAFDVINNLIARQQWEMKADVHNKACDHIREWENALKRLRDMHIKLRHHHKHR